MTPRTERTDLIAKTSAAIQKFLAAKPKPKRYGTWKPKIRKAK